MSDKNDAGIPAVATDRQSEGGEGTTSALADAARAQQLEEQLHRSDPSIYRILSQSELGITRVCQGLDNVRQAQEFMVLLGRAGFKQFPSAAEELYVLKVAKDTKMSFAEKEVELRKHLDLFDDAKKFQKEIRSARGYQSTPGEYPPGEQFKDFEYLLEKRNGIRSGIEKAYGKELGADYCNLLEYTLYRQLKESGKVPSGLKADAIVDELVQKGFDPSKFKSLLDTHFNQLMSKLELEIRSGAHGGRFETPDEHKLRSPIASDRHTMTGVFETSQDAISKSLSGHRGPSPTAKDQGAEHSGRQASSGDPSDTANDMVLDPRGYEAIQPQGTNQPVDRPISFEDVNEMLRKQIEDLNGKGNHEEATRLQRAQEKVAASPELRERAMTALSERLGKTGGMVLDGLGAAANAAIVYKFILELVGK